MGISIQSGRMLVSLCGNGVRERRQESNKGFGVEIVLIMLMFNID